MPMEEYGKSNQKRFNYVILLTACVNPNGMSFTKLQNTDERALQYIDALKWYLTNTEFKVVFVENTMSDFSLEFTDYINSGRLEYITFDGNNYDRCLGKGYGEGIIIEMALKKSSFIKHADYIIKITGRLILKNINSIINKQKLHNTDLVCTNTCLRNGQCLCLSHVFIVPPLFLQNYFIPQIGTINDSVGFFFEHLLYNCTLKWKKDHHKHTEFKLPLKIIGKSGSTGVEYSSGKFLALKAFVKYYLHKYSIYKSSLYKN